MNWHQFLQDYFSFSRKERIGIVVLLAIVSLTAVLPIFFSQGEPSVIQAPDSTLTAILTTQEKEPVRENVRESRNLPYKDYNKPAPAMFYFDPNTIGGDGWEKLGLTAKTIKTIQNYRSKGGRFKEPADLNKIYGLRQDDIDRLLPFVRIGRADNLKSDTIHARLPFQKEKPRRQVSYQLIDINLADTTQWIALPGIGSKLAGRIVNFREMLGGFYHINQVAETYGLPDSTFQMIRPYLQRNDPGLRKININTVQLNDLKSHPYFRSGIADAIINYRNEHGEFKQPEDLKKLMPVTSDVFEKISPYISIN